MQYAKPRVERAVIVGRMTTKPSLSDLAGQA